jgi:hypothetical protein
MNDSKQILYPNLESYTPEQLSSMHNSKLEEFKYCLDSILENNPDLMKDDSLYNKYFYGSAPENSPFPGRGPIASDVIAREEFEEFERVYAELNLLHFLSVLVGSLTLDATLVARGVTSAPDPLSYHLASLLERTPLYQSFYDLYDIHEFLDRVKS